MKHRMTKGIFTIIEQATLSAESGEPPVIEDDNEVFRTNTMSLSEEELVDEAAFVPEALSSRECMPQQNVKRAESCAEVSSTSPSISKAQQQSAISMNQSYCLRWFRIQINVFQRLDCTLNYLHIRKAWRK